MSHVYQREDFSELIEEAAQFHGIPNPGLVEKDYYVTEALRLIAKGFGGRVIFKGGTSLSKGWNLIQRFSEDIDLYIDPESRGTKARNTLLKALSSQVDEHPGLGVDETRTTRIDGLARSTYHVYTPYARLKVGGDLKVGGSINASGWGVAGGKVTANEGIRSWGVVEFAGTDHERSSPIAPSILLEAGIQSGVFPAEIRPISSLVGSFLKGQNVDLASEELESFDLMVLHFRRTFVEKLYALHDKVVRGLLEEGRPIGGYARHYYDIAQLLSRDEVVNMLGSGEIVEIAADYRRLTSMHFPRQALPPMMNLHESPALFPREEVAAGLAKDYVEQCETLCYRPFPTFSEVLGSLESVRSQLRLDIEAETES